MISKFVRTLPFSSLDANNQVINQRLLVKFRTKRSHWFSCHEAGTSEPNAIQKQLMSMLVSDMQYRVFRKESTMCQVGTGFAIPLVQNLSYDGYVFSQIFAIRRLIDGAGDVLSIRRVLKEISDCRCWITRENFVSYDGTPYDPSSWKSLDSTGLEFTYGIFDIDAPGLADWLRSKNRHERFDSLAGTNPADRTRTDLIKPEIIERLESWIKDSGAGNYQAISHKYFAHAAQASSIPEGLAQDISMAEIEKIQRALVRTAKAIFDVILCSEVFSEPVPMLPLGFFGTVWTDEGQLIESTARMQQHWDELAEDRNAWTRKVEEDLVSVP